MTIEKVNGFFVPANDVHINDWKAGQPFTQNKCLQKFLDYCENKNKKFNYILDIGAWVGTWSVAMNKYCGRIVAFEPDPLHYECLIKNVPEDVETHQLAVGQQQKMISLSKDNFTQSKRDDVDVIKIDVEGYEMEVLKGALETLKTTKYLMIELNNNTKKYGSNNIDVENYLKELGFKVLMNHWPDKVFHRI